MTNLTNIDDSKVYAQRSLSEYYEEIKEIYLKDNRPWVVAYSGGKDSTATLQLVWRALEKLKPEERKKEVFVLSADTLVDNPLAISLIDETIEQINSTAIEKNLPIKALVIHPDISDTFWVKVIGKGYPTPSKSFRWCTDRLKIKPSQKFVSEKISEYGEIIQVLGVRREESATRAKSIESHKIKNRILSKHTTFPQALVYTPVEHFTTEEIWDLLLKTPCPWGQDNSKLYELYKYAQAMGRPLTEDEIATSGEGRFGCWVCTLVTKDKAIEAQIENGEEWLKPLRDIRNYLSDTQIPSKKHEYRSYKRLNGKVQFKKDKDGNTIPGAFIYGPYKFEVKKKLLKMLLEAQLQVRKEGPYPNINLILPEELHEIRRIWRLENGDWKDSLPAIYKEITGEDISWVGDDLGTFSALEENILDGICTKHDLPLRLVTKLLDVEHEMQGFRRRSAVYSKIDSILNEEWRSQEDILEDEMYQGDGTQ